MFRRLSAPRLIALGFASFMGLGTLLLKLPALPKRVSLG